MARQFLFNKDSKKKQILRIKRIKKKYSNTFTQVLYNTANW